MRGFLHASTILLLKIVRAALSVYIFRHMRALPRSMLLRAKKLFAFDDASIVLCLSVSHLQTTQTEKETWHMKPTPSSETFVPEISSFFRFFESRITCCFDITITVYLDPPTLRNNGFLSSSSAVLTWELVESSLEMEPLFPELNHESHESFQNSK